MDEPITTANAAETQVTVESEREQLAALQAEYESALRQTLQIIEEKKTILLEARILVLELGKVKNELALLQKKLDTNNARMLAIKQSLPGKMASRMWRLYRKAVDFIRRKTRKSK